MKTSNEKRFRILVADDSEDAREVIRNLLEDEGYQVRTCADVNQALCLLDQERFDLVITDLRMPKISGMELVRHVRQHLGDVEIMMVTGYPTIEGAVSAMKTGAENYLPKPFTDREDRKSVV